MSHRLRETAIHFLAASAAWALAHSLSGRLFKERRNRTVLDDVREALVKSGTHAASVVLASLIVRRVLT